MVSAAVFAALLLPPARRRSPARRSRRLAPPRPRWAWPWGDGGRDHLFAAGATIRRAHEPGGDADVPAAGQDRVGRTSSATSPRSSPAASPASLLAAAGSWRSVSGPVGQLRGDRAGDEGRRRWRSWRSRRSRSADVDGAERVEHAAAAPDSRASPPASWSGRYITLEAPLSGMSMNPARTLRVGAAGRRSPVLWIYFTAPLARHAACARASCFAPLGARICTRVRAAPSSHHPAATSAASSTAASKPTRTASRA